MANTYDWGESPWGEFIFGAGGVAILGYPAVNPTETLALAALDPYDDPLELFQTDDISNGGAHYIYDKGLPEQTFELSLRLTLAEKTALKTFFETTALGKANPVYYADPYGEEHVVRIVTEKFSFPEQKWNQFVGSMTLREEP
jgi:hypothetical protein